MWSLGEKEWRSVDEAGSKVPNEPYWDTPGYVRRYVDLRKERVLVAIPEPPGFAFANATDGANGAVLPPVPKS